MRMRIAIALLVWGGLSFAPNLNVKDGPEPMPLCYPRPCPWVSVSSSSTLPG